VILITDGGDNSSSRTPAEIIALANRHRIRVFTVGLGSGINSMELELVALLTGGRYYEVPNAGSLAGVYSEISTLLRQHFQECMITYEAQCADGGLRNVDLQLKDYCNGSATQSRSWRAPLDSTTFTPLHLDLGEVFARHGEDFTMPLNLRTSIHGNNLYPIRFTLAYDTSILQFKSVTAPPGSLLDGVAITATPVSNGIRIESTSPVIVTGGGRLMDLTFATRMRSDTLCLELRPLNAEFAAGCFAARMDTGRVCLSRTLPMLSCSLTAPPQLEWRQDAKDYEQNPFTVTGRFDNTCDVTASNARFTILYNRNDIELLSPATDIQTLSPSHIDPGTFALVSWQVAAKPRASEDTIEICILGSFDYHPEVTCCARIVVSQAGTVLSCALSVPQIVADTVAIRYVPMPFQLLATVTNAGGTRSDNVWTRLQLPPEIELAPPETYGNFSKPLLPANLAPKQSGSVNWLLLHPIVPLEKTYTLTVHTWVVGHDTSVCNVNVRIPALQQPAFNTQLTVSGSLAICGGDSVMLDAGSGYLSYNWSHGQQTQRIAVKNAGSYFCVVRRTDGLIGRTDTAHVTVLPQPQPLITPGTTTWFCIGDSIVLGIFGNYMAYQWSTGATTPEIVVRTDGKYHVRVQDFNGCWGQSATTTVTAYLKPDKPVIQRTGDLLSVAAGYQCQWFRNGIAITGATQPALVVTQPGSYQVRYMSSKGCTVVSDPFVVTVLGFSDDPPIVENSALEAWPEPVGDLLRIRISDVDAQPVTLLLYDIRGRAEVLHSGLLSGNGAEFSYSLNGREAGAYYLVAVLRESVLVRRVTKM
jgi:hypothetical protein